VSKKKGEQFEESLKKLEGIVEKLERGNLPLEDAMEAFTEGVRLVRHCHLKLEEAESTVQLFLKSEDGNCNFVSFEAPSTGDPAE
jgi:exodeoxyribonuclease VII small subunit